MHPKTDEQRRRLQDACRDILLFKTLEQVQQHKRAPTGRVEMTGCVFHDDCFLLLFFYFYTHTQTQAPNVDVQQAAEALLLNLKVIFALVSCVKTR